MLRAAGFSAAATAAGAAAAAVALSFNRAHAAPAPVPSAPASRAASLALVTASRLSRALLLAVLPTPVYCDAGMPMEGGEEAGPSVAALAAALSPPPDFDDTEFAKSFAVQEVSGLSLTLMPGLGPPERERLAAQLTLSIDRSAAAMFVVSDDRKRPGLSTVVQPSPEGRVLRLAGSMRPAEGLPLTLTSEVSMGASRIYGGGAGARVTGPDFAASLQAKSGGAAGKTLEFVYHQAVVETPTLALSLGGSLAAQVAHFLPTPAPLALAPTAFGILSSRSRGASLLARWAAEGNMLSLTAHRQASKTLEVGAKLAVNTATLESSVAVGARLQLGHDAYIGGPPLTLTANMTTDLRVAMSLQHFYITAFAPGTQMISSLHGTFDHRTQEHSVGAQVQLAY